MLTNLKRQVSYCSLLLSTPRRVVGIDLSKDRLPTWLMLSSELVTMVPGDFWFLHTDRWSTGERSNHKRKLYMGGSQSARRLRDDDSLLRLALDLKIHHQIPTNVNLNNPEKRSDKMWSDLKAQTCLKRSNTKLQQKSSSQHLKLLTC